MISRAIQQNPKDIRKIVREGFSKKPKKTPQPSYLHYYYLSIPCHSKTSSN